MNKLHDSLLLVENEELIIKKRIKKKICIEERTELLNKWR